jgi:hypothetical protein
MERVLEDRSRIVMLYRKHGAFAAEPGLTVEVFDLAGDQVRASTVYWGVEEVAARFRPRDG